MIYGGISVHTMPLAGVILKVLIWNKINISRRRFMSLNRKNVVLTFDSSRRCNNVCDKGRSGWITYVSKRERKSKWGAPYTKDDNQENCDRVAPMIYNIWPSGAPISFICKTYKSPFNTRLLNLTGRILLLTRSFLMKHSRTTPVYRKYQREFRQWRYRCHLRSRSSARLCIGREYPWKDRRRILWNKQRM